MCQDRRTARGHALTVTVCIPAYRSGPSVMETVRSALRQTHQDLQVVVSIDPPEDGSADPTAAALEPLCGDPRLSVRTNVRRLGWAENVNSLLSSVRTPLYCILPHDDVWHPRHVETLVDALSAAPHAAVAYGDIMRFGATPPVRKSVTIPTDADRTDGLLHFLVQGTEAQAWRGVTRTVASQRIGGFPADSHKGFVVECEYALALHGVGAVVHVPQTLYFKRVYDHAVMSASRERMQLPQTERRIAWQEHDRRMGRLLSDALLHVHADAIRAALAHAAKEAALMRRYQQFVEPILGPNEVARISASVQECVHARHHLAGQVAANLHMVMRRHWLAAGDHGKADIALDEAARSSDTPEVATAIAERLLVQGRAVEAIERATAAIRLGHCDDTRAAQNVIAVAYAKLGW
jgi:hypothetical protein